MEPVRPPVLLLTADQVDGFEAMAYLNIVDDQTAAEALAVLVRGAGLAISVSLTGAARHRFLEDLHKLAEPIAYQRPDDVALSTLKPIQLDLIAALADGSTVTAAADALHLSRRTASRNLASAREHLGVTTNAQAVRRWVTGQQDHSRR